MILWSHLTKDNFCDLFLHPHLVIKSDHSAQEVVSRSSGFHVFPPLQDLKRTEPPFELQACFPPCFSQVFFSRVFFSNVFFLEFFSQILSQLPAADDGAAIWAASMFSSLSIRHNMIDFSLKGGNEWENKIYIENTFKMSNFLTYLMCVAVIAGRAKRIIGLT